MARAEDPSLPAGSALWVCCEGGGAQVRGVGRCGVGGQVAWKGGGRGTGDNGGVGGGVGAGVGTASRLCAVGLLWGRGCGV